MGPQMLSVEPKSQGMRRQSALLLLAPGKVDEGGSSSETYLMKNLFQIFWHCWRSSITSRRSLDKALPFSSMLCKGRNSLFWMLSDFEMSWAPF